MPVRLYKSTDASAPVLTGAAGSLAALLDAVLVNGYGAKAAAGWTIGFTAANKRAYLQNLTGANNPAGMYLYLDDTGPGAGGVREARACGFETMSAITPTGTGQFPISAQLAIGVGTVVIRKSTSVDATPRAWTIIANGQTIYLFIDSGDNTLPLAATTFFFGDIKPYKTVDPYAVMICGRTVENSGNANCDTMQACGNHNSATYTPSNSVVGMYIARHWTGVGGSKQCGKVFDWSKVSGDPGRGGWNGDAALTANNYNSITMTMGRYNNGAPAYPNGPDNGIFLSSVFVNHNGAYRGYMPGLFAPLHDRPLNHNDTVTLSSGSMNGKSLVALSFQAYILGSANGDNGQVLVEFSDTWS